VWFVLFGLRRGSFWVVLVIASLAMLGIAAARAPRHQDLLMVHQGLVVLGLLTATASFLAFLALAPIVRHVGPLATGVRRVDGAVHTAPGVLAFLLVVLVAVSEEVFWRGYVQGRLAEDVGPERAFRLTAVTYAAAHLLTFNLALIVAALACGSLWGWLRLRTGSVVPAVLSHCVFVCLMVSLYPV